MKLKTAAIGLALAATTQAHAIDEASLRALRTALPNGIPNYLDWNDLSPETMRRAEHLASTPETMNWALELQRRSDLIETRKVLGFGGAVAFSGIVFVFNLVKWQLRKDEADARAGE